MPGVELFLEAQVAPVKSPEAEHLSAARQQPRSILSEFIASYILLRVAQEYSLRQGCS